MQLHTHTRARVSEHQKLSALSSSDVHAEWHEDICALLGYYAALSGSSVPTLRDNRSAPIFMYQEVQEEITRMSRSFCVWIQMSYLPDNTNISENPTLQLAFAV
jgi:hypothetical protein